MENNHKYKQQEFAGHSVAGRVLERLQSHMLFHHAYLYSKDTEKGTGVVHVHILYDLNKSEDSNDQSAPVFAGLKLTLNIWWDNKKSDILPVCC